MNNIGSYKIERVLGQNINQARTTYLASDDKGLVVIKQFSFRRGGNWSSYKDLEKEFLVLQRLNHPKIPKYIGHLETVDFVILVQEYIEAENLNSRYFKEETIWQIARQILDILSYVHDLKIVHKDIKPANILFSNQTAYLVDFGFSSDLSLAQPGASSTFLGTAGFMPPEVFHQGKVCSQGDLYSLGITLFCLLAKIEAEEIHSYIDEENYSLDLSNLEIEPKFKQWLLKLSHISLKQRFSSARLALDRLDELLNEPQILLDVREKATETGWKEPEELGYKFKTALEIEGDFPSPTRSDTEEIKNTAVFRQTSILYLFLLVVAIVVSVKYLLPNFEGMLPSFPLFSLGTAIENTDAESETILIFKIIFSSFRVLMYLNICGTIGFIVYQILNGRNASGGIIFLITTLCSVFGVELIVEFFLL